MTREDAIAELKTRYFSMSQCLQVEELHKANEAIDLAIEALQTEPIEVEAAKEQKAYNKGFEDCRQAMLKLQTEPCEDAISRKMAIDEFIAEKDAWEYYGIEYFGKKYVQFDAVVTELKRLPSVKPQKVGRWIKNTDCNGKLYGWYHCSECGAVIGTPESAKYCSECGSYNAKMEEGE